LLLLILFNLTMC